MPRGKYKRRDFWSKVDRSAPGGCWLWKQAPIANGYGRTTVGYRRVLAHRLAWELTHGAIPDGLCVLHRCDVRLCVNPAHLFLGIADNNADRDAKGRGANRHGAFKCAS